MAARTAIPSHVQPATDQSARTVPTAVRGSRASRTDAALPGTFGKAEADEEPDEKHDKEQPEKAVAGGVREPSPMPPSTPNASRRCRARAGSAMAMWGRSTASTSSSDAPQASAATGSVATATRSSARTRLREPPVGPPPVRTRVASTTVRVGSNAAAELGAHSADVLVEAGSRADDGAEPVLHPKGHAGQRVVLDHRDVDQAGRLGDGTQHLPPAQGRCRRGRARRCRWSPGGERCRRRREPRRRFPTGRTTASGRGRCCRVRSPTRRRRRGTGGPAAAIKSGSVFAACSGVRSQAALGLMATRSPAPTKRSMPPSAARARRRFSAGPVPPATASRPSSSAEVRHTGSTPADDGSVGRCRLGRPTRNEPRPERAMPATAAGPHRRSNSRLPNRR